MELQTKINLDDIKLYSSASAQLKHAKEIRDYCMGGHAVVTLISPTKVHRTYYIWAIKDGFIKGPINDAKIVHVRDASGWSYLGELRDNGTVFYYSSSSIYSIDSSEVKGIRYLIKMMQKDFDTPMVVQHEGCCALCGRRLTHPKSIERGFGPKCFQHKVKT